MHNSLAFGALVLLFLPLMATAQPPAPDKNVRRAYGVLERVWIELDGTKYYARRNVPTALAPYAPDLALQLGRNPDGTVPDDLLAGTISNLAMLDPARAAQWGVPKIAAMKPGPDRQYTLASLALAIAGSRPEEALTLYHQAAAQTHPVSLGEGPDFSGVLLAALAARLHQPEADGLLSQALADAQSFIAAKGGKDEMGLYPALAEAAAMGSPALAEKVVAQTPAGKQDDALARAIPGIARYDAATAQRLLARLDLSGFSYGLAAKSVVAALGKTDPAGALALARTVQNSAHRAMALALAAQAQTPDVAAPLFREAVEMTTAATVRNLGASQAQIAAMAYESDPALGKDLFAVVRAHLDPNAPTRGGVLDYAFYAARMDPKASRRVIEAEYARRLKDVTPDDFWQLLTPALAMAAVDTDRALAMAQAIPKERDHAGVRPARRADAYRDRGDRAPVQRLKPRYGCSASTVNSARPARAIGRSSMMARADGQVARLQDETRAEAVAAVPDLADDAVRVELLDSRGLNGDQRGEIGVAVLLDPPPAGHHELHSVPPPLLWTSGQLCQTARCDRQPP